MQKKEINEEGIFFTLDEVTQMKENLSSLLGGFVGLKLSMANNPSIEQMINYHEKKCIEVFEILDKNRGYVS